MRWPKPSGRLPRSLAVARPAFLVFPAFLCMALRLRLGEITSWHTRPWAPSPAWRKQGPPSHTSFIQGSPGLANRSCPLFSAAMDTALGTGAAGLCPGVMGCARRLPAEKVSCTCSPTTSSAMKSCFSLKRPLYSSSALGSCVANLWGEGRELSQEDPRAP